MAPGTDLHRRAFQQFDNLDQSSLASSMRAHDHHYRVLCDAFGELSREPKHFTLFMKRLRMLVVEGRSFQDIASSQEPPVKTETLWAQISKTARELLTDVGMKGSSEDFKKMITHLKRAEFEVKFQPWLAWYSQWRGDPLGVEPPPPVRGLVANELFERLGLGPSQQGKGVSGTARPGRAPERVRREFSVHPFERDGFFGVEVCAVPEAFSDCPDVMPRPRALVLGYHELVGRGERGAGFGPRRNPALDPSPSEPVGEVILLPILEGRNAENGDRLVGSTGALESLRRGIGPFDLNALTAIREICNSGHAAYLDIFPFARGDRHLANSLRFPKSQLDTLSITHARLRFAPEDVAALRAEGQLTFSVIGYGPEKLGSTEIVERGELGRVDILRNDSKLRVRFTPGTALSDPRSRWYRGEVLNPRLEEILEGALAEVPSIGWREINRDPSGRYPSFHILNQDFCLSRSFGGDQVFVHAEVLPPSSGGSGSFALTAYSDEMKHTPLGVWTTEIGLSRKERVWIKGEVR
jgi:hypothetical protein